MLVVAAQSLITYGQAIVLGVLQGVTELFPISSLGHTVIFPNLFGWHNIVGWQSQPESPWLAFVVMLHVGSAVVLLIYFWRTWLEVIGAFFEGFNVKSRATGFATSRQRVLRLFLEMLCDRLLHDDEDAAALRRRLEEISER